uniref:Uncharacterized protein n=1 Tax=Lynx canadensis TaxID=61383 RepID=A0A667HWC2_LYNCA
MYRKLDGVHLAQSHDQFFSLCLFPLGDTRHRLRTQDVASPVTVDLTLSVIVIGPDGFHLLSQTSFVFQINLCEGNSGAGLPVNRMPQPGLPLDNAVGNPTGQAARQPLNGIHIMCNHYQLSLLVFYQDGDNNKPSSKDRWPLNGDILFAGSFLLSPGQQSLLLLLLCLWSVFVGQSKQLSICLVVHGQGELVNRRRHV